MTWSRSLFEREKPPLLVWISKNEVATNSKVVRCGSSIKQQLLRTFGGFGEQKWYISKISRINAVFCAFYILLEEASWVIYQQRGYETVGHCKDIKMVQIESWKHVKQCNGKACYDHFDQLITPSTIGSLLIHLCKTPKLPKSVTFKK